MRTAGHLAVAALLAVPLWTLTSAGCAAQDAQDASAEPAVGANELTPAEVEAGWRLLFDGRTLDGWRGYQRDTMPDGWAVVDGTLARVSRARDIITTDQFEDFELALEWRLEEGGNSGVFYLATEEPRAIYHGAPEMQILDDDGHRDGRSTLTSAGSNYALHPAPRGVVEPVGGWNSSRIVVHDDTVEHWLNGRLIVRYELASDDWKRRVAESKFAEWPEYGQARRGHIGLQEHGSPVWYRNIRIREIR